MTAVVRWWRNPIRTTRYGDLSARFVWAMVKACVFLVFCWVVIYQAREVPTDMWCNQPHHTCHVPAD